jgi:hypothetical protein
MIGLSAAAILLLGRCQYGSSFVTNHNQPTPRARRVHHPIGSNTLSSEADAAASRQPTSLHVFSDLPNPFEAFKVPEGIVNAPSEAFDPSPAGLIRQAKRVLSSDLGLQDPSLLDDAKFRWIGPVVDQPLGKTDYLAAGRFFDLRSAFPDYDYRSYDFRVDEDDPTTVRFTCRVTGTMRGELRLRSGILPPTGKRMICPPEAMSLTFDLRTGNVVKMCTGFCLDRQVGNTDGTTGVMAAATVAGQPMSDWDLYPPASVVARFFGRPSPQLPESKAFLAPFPETVMIQLAKGVLAANMAADDPTLLSDDFTYLTPAAGPVKKREFLEKYATDEFDGGVNPTFSFFRVDPYDPVRVWVDVKPTAPGYVGAPQAMSFTFDDEGFCTRITSRAVMDPTTGNGGGLGGPEGYRYATGRGVSDFSARPLPRILGRLRKRLLQPVTGVAPDDYVLPGQTITPFAQRPVPPVERQPAESLSSLRAVKPASPAAALMVTSKDSDAEAARRRKLQEEAEQRTRESLQKVEAQRSAAKAKQDALAEGKRRQAEARAAEAEKRRNDAERSAQEKAAAQKAAAERRQRELERQRDEKLAAQQAALARKKQDQDRRQKEMQAQREKQQSAIAAQKAEAERKQRELQEQRERALAAQRGEAEAKKRAVLEAARARGEALQREKDALQQSKELAARQVEVQRKKQLALKDAQARAVAEREEAERMRRQEEEIRKREEQSRLEEERRRRLEAERRAELERQAASREAAAAAAEAERRRQDVERQREVERRKEQEEARMIAEQRRKADEEARRVAKNASELAKKVELERQKRQKAAEAELKRAKSSTTLRLFGLGGGKPTPAPAKEERQKAASQAASQAKPGASIPLFFFGGSGSQPVQKDSGAPKKAKAAADIAAKSAPRPTISLFGSGGGAPADSGRQRRQEAANAAATNATPRTSISLFGMGGDQTPKQKPTSTTAPRPTLSLFGPSSAPAPSKPAAATASSPPRPTLSIFGQSTASSAASKVSKPDLDREKRKKAALDAVSGAPSRGTVSLFGTGGRKVEAPNAAPKAAAGAAVKAATAPPGVPTLRNWRKNPGDTVTGIIGGSRSFRDGEKVTTSKIVSGKLASGQVVRTGSGSRYFLQ